MKGRASGVMVGIQHDYFKALMVLIEGVIGIARDHARNNSSRIPISIGGRSDMRRPRICSGAVSSYVTYTLGSTMVGARQPWF